MQREFTDAWLRGLALPAKGRNEHRDARQRNLVLRVTADGICSWSVQTRTKAGARTRVTIGRWPEVGIAEARRRARAVLAEVANGANPMAERRAEQEAEIRRRLQPTVAARLLEWRLAKVRRWSTRHADEVARIVKRDILPALGARPLKETVRCDWTALVALKHETAPAMASLLYRVISAFLGHAEASGWIELPLLPRKGLTTLAPAVAARSRVLSDSELVAVWQTSESLPARQRAFVRLLILSAAREMEVADISVGEIELDEAARWTIPATRAKNHRKITLPLGPLMVAELAQVQAGADGRFLRIRGFSKLKVSLDRLSQVEGWRFHDLRRTARTAMARIGVPREHAEAALNHLGSRSALERTYDRHDFAEEIITASLRWQAYVSDLVGEAPTAEVIQLYRSGS